MKNTLSLAFASWLLTSALPATAQTAATLPQQSFAAAISREAVRLADEGQVTPPDVARRRALAEMQWAHVRAVAPGAALRVATHSRPPATRYFVEANDDGLVVLNLDADGLLGSTRNALRTLATTQPHVLAEVASGAVATSGNVRVTAEGVFVSKEKVADLSTVLATVPRADVVEIGVMPKAGHPVAIGALVGFLTGTALAAIGAAACKDNCDMGGKGKAFAFYEFVLGGIGTGIGAGAGGVEDVLDRRPPNVIYRAQAE